MEWSGLKRDIASTLATNLTATLPEIGGPGWWQNYVLSELTPAQRVQVDNLAQPDLFQFDMAALIRLYVRNWSELAFKQNYPRNGRKLIMDHHGVDVRSKSLGPRACGLPTLRRFIPRTRHRKAVPPDTGDQIAFWIESRTIACPYWKGLHVPLRNVDKSSS